jgi:hypothetical protein
VFSHRYAAANQTTAEKINRLSAMVKDFPRVCEVPSCHKVAEYVNYLREPEKSKLEYSKNRFRSANAVFYPDMKNNKSTI